MVYINFGEGRPYVHSNNDTVVTIHDLFDNFKPLIDGTIKRRASIYVYSADNKALIWSAHYKELEELFVWDR